MQILSMDPSVCSRNTIFQFGLPLCKWWYIVFGEDKDMFKIILRFELIYFWELWKSFPSADCPIEKFSESYGGNFWPTWKIALEWTTVHKENTFGNSVRMDHSPQYWSRKIHSENCFRVDLNLKSWTMKIYLENI